MLTTFIFLLKKVSGNYFVFELRHFHDDIMESSYSFTYQKIHFVYLFN